MTTLWWFLTILLMLVGLGGTMIPIVPGTTLILCGAVLHHLTLGEYGPNAGWWTIGGMAVLVVISYILEFISGSVGAKVFGATRWGAIGGIVGTIVGMFFFPVGIFVGPLVGVLVGELLGGRGILPAGKSTWGTLLGTSAGIVANVAIGITMIAWFFLAVVY